MSKSLNPKWVTKQKELMAEVTGLYSSGKPYETVQSAPIVKTFIVAELTERGIPFKIYNMGAGVVKITTDTNTCPCCKRKL